MIGHYTEIKGLIKASFLALSLVFAGQLSAQTNKASEVNTNIDTPSSCYEFGFLSRISWDSTYHNFYTWTANGDLLTKISHYYDGNNFVQHLKIDYSRNLNGQPLSTTTQTWSNGNWENLNLQTIAYDLQGNEILNYNFQWRVTSFGADWDTIAGSRKTLVYNPQQQIESQTVESWTTTGWLNTDQTTYHFNAANLPDTIISYTYLGSWIARERKFDFDWHDYAQNQASEWLSQVYAAGSWTDQTRSNCLFVDQDSECWFEEWNGSTWDTTRYEIKLYDSLDAPIRDEIQAKTLSWTITGGQKWTYVYDNQGRKLETIRQSWNPLDGYVNDTRILCTEFATDLTEASIFDAEILSYPNPASNQISIRFKQKRGAHYTLQLFDLTGQLRVAGELPATPSEYQLDLSTFEEGQYLLRIHNGKQFQTQKIIVAR